MNKAIAIALAIGAAATVSMTTVEVSAQQNIAKVPWKRMPGVARHMATGGGQVYHVGRKKGPGGFQIYRWNGKTWDDMKGSGLRIAVGPKGYVWTVTNKQNIFRHNGTKWLKMPGKAHDIAIGANGAVWVIGINKVPGGFGIYRLRNNGWQKIDGGARRIAVGPKGNAVVTNDKGGIFRFDGKKWNRMNGRSVAVAVNGKPPFVRMWALGWGKAKHGRFVYAWNGKSWTRHAGQLSTIAADAAGLPLGNNLQGAMFAHAGSRIWRPAPLVNNLTVWQTRQTNTKKLIDLNRKKAAELQKQIKSIQRDLTTVNAEHKKLTDQMKKVEVELAKLK